MFKSIAQKSKSDIPIKILFIKTIKITASVISAVFISNSMSMSFSLSAGIIALVSILGVKRQSLRVAGQRLVASIFSLSLASLLFLYLGFDLTTFGIYLAIFSALMIYRKTIVALVTNVVLVVHIYSLSTISWEILLNEIGLLVIGISCALVFNYYTKSRSSELIKKQLEVENQLKNIFNSMGYCLKNQCKISSVEDETSTLKRLIFEGKNIANDEMNDYYLKDRKYFWAYFTMREQQYYILDYMRRHFYVTWTAESESEIIYNIVKQIESNVHESNPGDLEINMIKEARAFFKISHLPETRLEFEHRASLYQFLNDLETILILKKRFLNEYWNIRFE
jgi:uncharacterized membrane protein YgaE (UPF0421/DUF939 family)